MKKIICIIIFVFGVSLGYTKDPELYLFLDGDSVKEHLNDINHPQVKGVQIIYSWRKLEPSKDNYNFSDIESDYKELSKLNKKLFIQLQDKTFEINRIPVPDYLRTKEYDYGIQEQVDFAGEGQPIGAGWVTKQWNTKVRERFQKLIYQLGKKFNGKVEGINLPETSVDIEEKYITEDFCSTYVDSVISNIKAVKKAFPDSYIVQYINFLPCEWNNDHGYMEKIFNMALESNIGVGNPDTVPYRKGQMKNSYPFFNKYKSKLDIVTIAVQEPDYTYTNPKTNRKFTVKELYNFNKDYIGANIIFWNIKKPQFDEVLEIF
ncbi:hypothetical protein [Francisella frigiditurris]|uniref:Uncharacterized protein n=1 Tax=Francisella frigiditurris TaxID=1542390 RepID=A0A1J0KVY8_9GAMM|nr:hypothetical protein [Francisella frigiditurris]APC97834.1 hypothetical protein KX01_1565 [Francisella frigiditurris]